MTDMVRPDVFSRFPVFAGLEADTRSDMARLGSSHRWTAGQMIFQRGDSDDRMIAVLTGRIRLSLMTPQGRELVLTSVGPGEVLGELALLDGEPRSTDAMATEATTAILLTRERSCRLHARGPICRLRLPGTFAAICVVRRSRWNPSPFTICRGVWSAIF